MTEIVRKIKSVPWHSLLVILMVSMIAVGSESCKSTGKLSRKERKAQIEMYKKQLTEIVNGTSKLSLEEQERLISEAYNKHFDDPELNDLIIRAQQKTKALYADKEKALQQKIAEARTQLYDLIANKDNLTADELEQELAKIKALNIPDSEIQELIDRVEQKIEKMRSFDTPGTVKSQLESAFNTIVISAKGNNYTQAASVIQSTIDKYFSSPETPVLIIISREGSMVDYDKPTTIRKYLDFIKDQKESRNAVESYQLDGAGKIKELELIKK